MTNNQDSDRKAAEEYARQQWGLPNRGPLPRAGELSYEDFLAGCAHVRAEMNEQMVMLKGGSDLLATQLDAAKSRIAELESQQELVGRKAFQAGDLKNRLTKLEEKK